MKRFTAVLVGIIAMIAAACSDPATAPGEMSAPDAVAAAVVVDGTGNGFVGKGDVQLLFGWNNKQLQDNAIGVSFSMNSITEVSWICTNSNNENTQVRERTTTTEGLVSSIARDGKKQITGFNLTGFSGGSTTSTDGPPLNSCPSGPWSLTTPAGDPVLVSGGGLSASYNGGPPVLLQ